MRQSLRNNKCAGALVAVLVGLCASSNVGAAQSKPDADLGRMSADGWQMLKRPTADGGVPAQLVAQAASQRAGSNSADSGSVTPASTNPAPSIAPAGMFRLVKGELLQLQLQKWAALANWTISWNVPDSWIVPGDRDYGGDFEAAVQRVVEELATNGADVVGDSWRGNRTIIITQNGIMQ